MNKPSPSLTKICSSCGVQKPLSAFLQVGAKGGFYGDICASCRKTQMEGTIREDETTRRETGGSKIRANERVERLEKNAQITTAIEEEYHEDRDINEKDVRIETEQKINKAAIEKNQRSRPTSFLDSSAHLKRQHQAAQQQVIAQKEIQEKQEFDPSDTRFGSKLKQQGRSFKDLKNLFLGFAPISAAERAEQQNKQANVTKQTIQKKASSTAKFLLSKPKEKSEKPGPLTEAAEKNWGPRGPKR